MGRARTIIAPDGTTWVVRRQPLPGTRRAIRLRRLVGLRDVGDAGLLADSHPAGIVLGLVALVAVTVVVVLLLPLLILLAELLVILGAAAVGLFARFVLGRPWVVEAVPDAAGVQPLSWRVSGWSASRRAIHQVAEALRSGLEPRVGEGAGAPAERASVPPPSR
jgi:hypothetical protein